MIDLVGYRGPGGYSSCRDQVPVRHGFDDIDVKFYLKHPDLKVSCFFAQQSVKAKFFLQTSQWVPTSSAYAPYVPGVITLQPYSIQHGRINFTIANGTYNMIGRNVGGYLMYWIPGDNTETTIPRDFETLACQP